jgi:hypothetical protein
LSLAVPQRREQARHLGRDAHERLVVVGAVLATLAVIAGPGVIGALGLGRELVPRVEEARLSDNALQVLQELPRAYRTGATVVVPADSDPHVVWIGAVAAASMDGEVVELGARGLVPFGTLPTRGEVPAWRSAVQPVDRVFTDVGPLHFGCAPSSAGGTCHGTVLMRRGDRWHPLHPDLGAPGTPGVTRVSVRGGSGETGMWLGWVPEGAATAWATVVGHQYIRDVPARTSPGDAVGGATMWWVRASDPVSAVSFKDARGRVMQRVAVGD